MPVPPPPPVSPPAQNALKGGEAFRPLSCGAFSLVFVSGQLKIRGSNDIWTANSDQAQSVEFTEGGTLRVGNFASPQASGDCQPPFSLVLSPTGVLTITDSNFKQLWRAGGVQYVAPPRIDPPRVNSC